ncbi:MAG: tRNA 2-selenouridine(34) synthase MnmH [Saprospiraceae bacterium]|nr:tRNA 2-selenouridine(34) synthase MnmH [Saprospiraceae bacterium]MBK9632664.1 tRNA 2-selenouridine(34) synthase MnmH [Saprospiraceae bacterium]
MAQLLDSQEFLSSTSDRDLIDVRSPSEFLIGHIPGAYNLPLLSDEERKIVGTLYKQNSHQEAILKGLEFVGVKLNVFVKEVLTFCKNKKLAIYCWRGGQRSQSMAWLFKQAGFDVVILKNGYKAYRHWILDHFDYTQFQFVIIAGKTGSAKTVILKHLGLQNEQVIDLEKLAQHKGSAFGGIGEKPQPSFEQFGNNLFQVLNQYDISKRIWIENESKAIGLVRIPDGMWNSLIKSNLIELIVDKQLRIQHLVEVYSKFPKIELVNGFYKIGKRLGNLHLSQAIAAVENNDFTKAAEIGLLYYDKRYQHSLNLMVDKYYTSYEIDYFDFEKIAIELIACANKLEYER